MRSRTSGSSMACSTYAILTFMALAFRRVTRPALRDFEATAPDGAVIGVIGENSSGKGLLLRLAAGICRPVSGTVELSGFARLLALGDALNLSPAAVLLIDHSFAHQ